MRRLLVSAAVLVAAFWLAYRFCWVPYRCNNQIGSAVTLTEKVWLRSGQMSATIAARRLIAEMTDCLQSYPDVGAYMVAAANLRIVGRMDDALRLYRRALSLDRRPEIYLQIGNTQMEIGNHAEAVRYYTLAATFDPQYIYDRSVLPPEMWDEIYRRYSADELQYRNHAVHHPSASIE